MFKEFNVPSIDLILALSNAVDLVSPKIANHQKRVAYIAYRLGIALGFSKKNAIDLLIAGSLHDIGALSLKERLELLNFDSINPHKHAEIGYYFLRSFTPFSDIARMIRFHHLPWQMGEGKIFDGEEVLIGAHILHLSDRIEVLVDGNREVLAQGDEIRNKIKEFEGKLFDPQMVDVLEELFQEEGFWLDMINPKLEGLLRNKLKGYVLELDMDGLQSVAKLFSHVIDFRSSFTANHSSGVAASAEMLALLAGFSESECQFMRIAGYLHDLGKLAVPKEILEKEGTLTKDEIYIIKKHTYHTFRILESIKGLEIINYWAAFHHERLDGSGYPFREQGENLSLGSRIMAVADVFTAISEDRPYRKGMNDVQVLSLLEKMGNQGALDLQLVSLLKNNFVLINEERLKAQKTSHDEYRILSPVFLSADQA